MRKSKSSLKKGETPKQRDARMTWWREARFGLFIHWGIYSVPAGTYDGRRVDNIGEWIMLYGKIPVARYAQYAAEFNPTMFDAEKWVQLAQSAGMKYIVITAKHHDGFAMYRSKASPFNVFDATPFKRDPLAELAAACKKHGIKLGFYYSQCQDWHHAGGAVLKGGYWDKAQEGDFDQYLKDIALPQVKEILSDYGPVSILWFDTPTLAMTPQRAGEFLPLLDLQPGIIVNDRLGGGIRGDTNTPEQWIPPGGYPGRDFEVCMTINETWGYKSYDDDYKSTEKLLRNLVDIASKGGNYLLNVGPTAEGLIPQPQVDRLKQIGDWLKINGESIYGTGPTPFGDEAGSFDPKTFDEHGEPLWIPAWEWRCTTKPGKWFIHLFDWPGEKFELDGLKGKVAKAYLLADPGTTLKFQQNKQHITVKLPKRAPGSIDSVLVLLSARL